VGKIAEKPSLNKNALLQTVLAILPTGNLKLTETFVLYGYITQHIFVFSRSLLSKNAAPVYKLINDIFSMISKFEARLISHAWQVEDERTGHVTHPMFAKLQSVHGAFKQCIEFLFSGMYVHLFTNCDVTRSMQKKFICLL